MRYDALRQSPVRGPRKIEDFVGFLQQGRLEEMSTDITSTVEEVAFGAARAAREVASDPMGSARKPVKGLQRKGTPTARKLNPQVPTRLNAPPPPPKDPPNALLT